MTLLLPYELINLILKLSYNITDIYYMQIDYKSGKIIYNHNMKCPQLLNLPIFKPIVTSDYFYDIKMRFMTDML